MSNKNRTIEENEDFYNFTSNEKLKEFIKIHNFIMSEPHSSKKKLTINFSPEGGYGNKLYSYLSSLLIAILTDSALVVLWNFRGGNLDMNKYIDSPLKNMFESDFIDLNDICYLEPTQAWRVNKNVELLSKTKIKEDCTRYSFRNISSYFMEVCCNPIYYDKLLSYNLASKVTIENARKALSNEAMSDAKKQDYVFSVGYEVGGNLLNQIWMPRKRIRDIVNYYLNKEYKNNFVIGIQLRYHYLNGLFDTTKFIDCAFQIERDYRMFNSNSKLKKTTFRWFISSDTQTNIEEIFSVYGDRAFTANGTITHVFDNPDGYEKAIIDIELLSRCDEIIITGGSTYGFVASMKNKKLPFFINGKEKNMKRCLRHSLGYPNLSKTHNQDAVF
jgi:hypothetical protein